MELIEIHRGEIWRWIADPFATKTPEDAIEVIRDGALVVQKGKILHVADGPSTQRKWPNASVIEHGADEIIIPGFVDAHLHLPQFDIIGATGHGLLEWLDQWTFPAERRCEQESYVAEISSALVKQLLAFGVTHAAFYTSVHGQSAETLVNAVASLGLRSVIGKTSMNRHAPKDLCIDTDDDMAAIHKLAANIGQQKTDTIRLAITPRFAPSCTEVMLKTLGQYLDTHRNNKTLQVIAQTHYAETIAECQWVQEIFPAHSDYLAVYEDFGFGGHLTALGHGIHITQAEQERLRARAQIGDAPSIIHCPTSNMFLGSGLCDVPNLKRLGLRVGLGSDIGAGTSISPWATMLSAYKVNALRTNGSPELTPMHIFYLATQGGAQSLSHPTSGNLAPGYEADFVVLDPHNVPHLQERWDRLQAQRKDKACVQRLLGALFTGADERVTSSVYVAGERRH